MTLTEFVADLQNAHQNTKPAGILGIESGEYDGQFEILLALLDGDDVKPFRIITAVQNVEDYPNNHEYIIFTENNALSDMSNLLQKVHGANRNTVFEFLNIISTTLCGSNPTDNENSTSVTANRVEDSFVARDEDSSSIATNKLIGKLLVDEDKDVKIIEDEDVKIIEDEDVKIVEDEDVKAIDEDSSEYQDRLLADLRLAREAGFGVGLLGPITDFQYGCYGFIHVSIRMSELGISGEVLETWEIDPNEYLILIIHYPKGYKTPEELQGYDRQGYDKTAIGMRVVAGKYDRPIMEEAVNAFIKVEGIADYNVNETSTIRDIFISKQLSTLLEESLVPILRFRNTGMDWHGAESWFSDLQEMDENADPDAVPDRYFEPETTSKVLPDVVTADHYATNKSTKYSFPLLAMQFVLRHFVRCTEFCLTCHRKLNLDLEAIKPQTCERRLCLFRYLNMGLIEHEIIAQPYVVDLLVSFCYRSARAYKLKDYPDGLALTVPHVQPQSTATSSASGSFSNLVEYNIGFDYDRLEVNFEENSSEGCPVKKDSWIVIKTVGMEYHCRVAETSLYPVIVIDVPIILKGNNRPVGNQIQSKMPNWTPATLTIYNQDFDLLDNNQKCDVICKLLDTLPSVKEMQNYLADRHPGDLKNWVQRLSTAALRLFRWIIASNRACIMQVDGDSKRHSVSQERLYGMEGYMQFRFAMGAPDKEQRFLNEVREATERLKLEFPTIFAWHGSLLHNWHTIIREGLNFNSTVNGRVYGHGVYHALDAKISEAYSGVRKSAALGSISSVINSPLVTTYNVLIKNVNSPQNSGNFLPYNVNTQPNTANFSSNNGYPSFSAINASNSMHNFSTNPLYNSFQNTFNIPLNTVNLSSNTVNFLQNSANMPPNSFYFPPNNRNSWPNSVLNISVALALNEIVNAPNEFVSSNPFYVVSQLDWIQTRYLFVKCKPITGVHIGKEQVPANPHAQDPKRTPKGISGPIIIPASAIKSGRGLDLQAPSHQALEDLANIFGEGSGLGAMPTPETEKKRARPTSTAKFRQALEDPANTFGEGSGLGAMPTPETKKKRARPTSTAKFRQALEDPANTFGEGSGLGAMSIPEKMKKRDRPSKTTTKKLESTQK